MPEPERRFCNQNKDDNNVDRKRFRKCKLWTRVLEWIVDRKGGMIGTTITLGEAVDAIMSMDPKGDSLRWSKSKGNAELVRKSLTEGPPSGFNTLMYQENPSDYKKGKITLMERFPRGLANHKTGGKEVRELIFDRVRQESDGAPLPMGLCAPNRIRYPGVRDEDVPNCPFLNQVPPYFYTWTEQAFAREAQHTQLDMDNHQFVEKEPLYEEGGHYYVAIIGWPSESLVKLVRARHGKDVDYVVNVAGEGVNKNGP